MAIVLAVRFFIDGRPIYYTPESPSLPFPSIEDVNMLQSRSIRWLISVCALAISIPVAGVCGQEINPVAAAQESGPCPHQFMFAYGPYYYYCITNCPTGHQPGYLIFDRQVDTGCKGDACATGVKHYANITETEDIGGVAETPFEPLHKDTVMLRPTPAPNISVTVGFPKYVLAKVNETERVFLVYKGTWYHGASGSPYLLGVELAGLPTEETPTVDGTFISGNDTIVSIQVGSDIFKCLFKK